MTLVLKKKITQEVDGSKLYVEFFNATGAYNDPNNLGGFGAPNPIRNTLALIFYGNFKREDADILAVPEVYDPVTVASYTIPLPAHNGVINYFIFAVPIFNPVGTYVDGNIVYDNQGIPFLKKRVSGVWQPIAATVIIGDSTIVQTEGNSFPIPEMVTYRNGLNRERLLLLRDYVHGKALQKDYDTMRNNFDYVDSELEAATNDFCNGAYGEAQHKLEAVEDFSKTHPLI